MPPVRIAPSLTFTLAGQTLSVVLKQWVLLAVRRLPLAWWLPLLSPHQLLASWHTLVLLLWWHEVVHATNLTLTWRLLILHRFLFLPSDRYLGTLLGGLKSIAFAYLFGYTI